MGVLLTPSLVKDPDPSNKQAFPHEHGLLPHALFPRKDPLG
jgi:hypothetical protein